MPRSSFSGRLSRSSPRSSARPPSTAVSGVRRNTARAVRLLPQPDSPTRQVMAAGGSSRCTSRTAGSRRPSKGKCTERSSSQSRGAASGGALKKFLEDVAMSIFYVTGTRREI